MALILRDRVQETGTANTTLSFTLTGAVAGFQSFSAIGNTNTTYYAATDADGRWEAGLGTYSTTGPTLTRTTILSSSNSGSAVTFSGTVNVFCTYPSSRALYLNDGSTGINVSQAAFTANGITYASSTSALTTGSALTFDGTNFATTGRAKATAFQFAGTTATIPNPNAGFGYNSSNGNINVFSAGGTNIRLNQYGMNISPTDAAGVAKINVDPDGFTRWRELGPTATNAFGIHIPSGTNTYGPIGTLAGANTVAFGTVELAFGDEFDSTTVTRATTLYIDGAPTANATTTIGSSYALYVNSGESYFGNNIKIGSGANRGTTAGTNQIALFNGTAPVGTLTNGVSLYSSSGDLNFMDSAGAAYKVGFRNVPVNSQSAAYTTVLGDSGKFIFHPSTDANARTFTIAANSSVAYEIGTVLTFVNMTSQVVTIAIMSTDTMYLAGAGTTGSRSLAQYGMATAIKMTATTWLISGVGIS